VLATIVVGLIFAGIMWVAFKKTRKDLKDNKCNCGGSCSDISKCHKY